MKKKIVILTLVIAMIVVVSISFSACNSATTQGQLANLLHDHNHESFTYIAHGEDANGDVLAGYDGTYVVTLDAYDKGSSVENFGDRTLYDVSEGVLVLSTLTVGSTEIKSGCYYNLIGGSSFMVPAYTFRIHRDNGVLVSHLQGTYTGATLSYTYRNSAGSVENAITTKSTYFDNNEWHQSLRCATTLSTSFNFSFAVPAIGDNEAAYATLQSLISSTENVKTPYTDGIATLQADGIKCYKMTVSRNTDVSGLYHTLYYAVDDIKDAGWGMKNVLVKIVEPFKLDGVVCKMVYELTSLHLA